MNKLTALTLVIALPALAQQQVSLVPGTVQADASAALTARERPLYERPGTWIVASAATLAVAAVIAGIVTLGLQAAAGQSSSQRPGAGGAPPVQMGDFACDPMCDGWVNKPPK